MLFVFVLLKFVCYPEIAANKFAKLAFCHSNRNPVEQVNVVNLYVLKLPSYTIQFYLSVILQAMNLKQTASLAPLVRYSWFSSNVRIWRRRRKRFIRNVKNKCLFGQNVNNYGLELLWSWLCNDCSLDCKIISSRVCSVSYVRVSATECL